MTPLPRFEFASLGLHMTPWVHTQGHVDWLFGAAWVTERHVVTCSRDKSVKLWHVSETQEGGPVNQTPLHTALLHKARREYKCNRLML